MSATTGRPKGTRKTGGRAKGVRNRATREREQAKVQLLLAAALTDEQRAQPTPLDVMLRIMRARDAAGDDAGALLAASMAAPYVHAKLSASDVRVSGSLDTRPAEVVDAEIAEVEAMLAAARAVH